MDIQDVDLVVVGAGKNGVIVANLSSTDTVLRTLTELGH